MLTMQQLTAVEYKLSQLKNELVTKNERIKQKESLEEQLVKNKSALDKIMQEEVYYKQSLSFLVKNQNEKRKSDMESIEQSMLFASSLVEQKKELIPKFRTSSDKYPVTDIVIDKGIRPSKLSNVEGTGTAESISIMTTIAVLMATPYNKVLFQDERFSSVSPSNTARMSGRLERLIRDRFQMVIIEQKDEIVADAKHREFYIEYDGKNSYVKTYDVDELGNKIKIE